MSTTLASENHATPAHRLRATMAAVRVSFTWFGVRKALTAEQKAQAADTFGAEGQFLSAGKKLLDTGHSAYKTVTGIRNRIQSYWKGISLPYPEPGVRLIKQDDLDAFDAQLTGFKAELAEAVAQLDEQYMALQEAAREQLGQLYNPRDYPPGLRGMFDVVWDFPSVEPPEYLCQLSPDLYRHECERVTARFNEAVQLAEQAFFDELAKLVAHLTERLSGTEDGKPKVFRDSAIENLQAFFERFRHLNVGSSKQLDDLVQQAQRIVRRVEPQQLRDHEGLRQRVATQLSAVQSLIDGLMVDRPRRSILRRAK